MWTKDEIRKNIENSDAWLCRAIRAIYRFQTEHEKCAENTLESNGVGFNGIDAAIMSSFAQQLEAGRGLSKKQFAIARKRMVKYSGQLTKIANKEIR